MASLRRSDATWLSTVRTEMNSRCPICSCVRWEPSRPKTSRSRSVTLRRSTAASVAWLTAADPYRYPGNSGCADPGGRVNVAAQRSSPVRAKEADMGSAKVQGPLWGRHPDVWSSTMEQKMRPLYLATIGALRPLAGKAFLDAGCGAGQAAADAAASGASVSGIDASEPLLEIARRRTPSGDFQVGDIEALPFGDCSFDAVTAFNAIQYATDPAAAVAELARVCRGGGSVAIGVWGDPARCETEALFARLRTLAPPP